jgi:Domain of unknown function (DUF1792).
MHLAFFSERELKRIKKEYPKVLSVNETLDLLIKNRASLTRFGDGEFSIFLERKLGFQRCSKLLAGKIGEVLDSPPDPKLIIAIVSLEFEQQEPGYENRRYNFSQWFWLRCWKFLKNHLRHPFYGNAFVSRLKVFEEASLEKIKSVWNDRDVVFIVPANGRFVMDNRLFDNIKSAEFVHVPPTDAFDSYDTILQEALQHDKEKLYFIAAGPTATVLAFDLHKSGRQAVDFGHLPNCFRQFLGECKAPEKMHIVADTNYYLDTSKDVMPGTYFVGEKK